MSKKHHRATVALCGIAATTALTAAAAAFLPGWIAFCLLVLGCSTLVWLLR
jgi:hypothetical protein